jgi:hypothetical protein
VFLKEHRVAHTKQARPDVVGCLDHHAFMGATIDHPQSRPSDFYRELGDRFGVPLSMTWSTDSATPT